MDFKKTPVTTNSEITAMHDGLSALSADVISMNRILWSQLDMLRLDVYVVYLAVIASNTAHDNDIKVLHSLFNLLQN